jgi:hypothetical protein
MYDWKEYMFHLYFDPSNPGSYSSVEKLYQLSSQRENLKLGDIKLNKRAMIALSRSPETTIFHCYKLSIVNIF